MEQKGIFPLLEEETGGGRDLPGDFRTSWGHPRKALETETGAWEPQSPAAGSELGQEAEDGPASILWEKQQLQRWTVKASTQLMYGAASFSPRTTSSSARGPSGRRL